MPLSKYTSDVKFVDHSDKIIFNYLSDFENLASYITDGLLNNVTEQIPQIKITDFHSDKDSCNFKISGLGNAKLQIVNRTPNKSVKIESLGNMPLSITLWIQILPVEELKSKIRLTLHADMSMMIKMMAGKKLDEGINNLADMIARLPYK